MNDKEKISQEITEIQNFLLGYADKPECLEHFKSGVEEKLGLSILSITVANLTRVMTLQNRLTELENDIYSETALSLYTLEEKRELAKDTNNSINSILEFTRKLLLQNKDLLNKETDAGTITSILRTLPQDKLQSLRNILEGK